MLWRVTVCYNALLHCKMLLNHSSLIPLPLPSSPPLHRLLLLHSSTTLLHLLFLLFFRFMSMNNNTVHHRVDQLLNLVSIHRIRTHMYHVIHYTIIASLFTLTREGVSMTPSSIRSATPVTPARHDISESLLCG